MPVSFFMGLTQDTESNQLKQKKLKTDFFGQKHYFWPKLTIFEILFKFSDKA